MFDENFANVLAIGFIGVSLVSSIYAGNNELSFALGGGLMGFLGVSTMGKKG